MTFCRIADEGQYYCLVNNKLESTTRIKLNVQGMIAVVNVVSEVDFRLLYIFSSFKWSYCSKLLLLFPCCLLHNEMSSRIKLHKPPPPVCFELTFLFMLLFSRSTLYQIPFYLAIHYLPFSPLLSLSSSSPLSNFKKKNP